MLELRPHLNVILHLLPQQPSQQDIPPQDLLVVGDAYVGLLWSPTDQLEAIDVGLERAGVDEVEVGEEGGGPYPADRHDPEHPGLAEQVQPGGS